MNLLDDLLFYGAAAVKQSEDGSLTQCTFEELQDAMENGVVVKDENLSFDELVKEFNQR